MVVAESNSCERRKWKIYKNNNLFVKRHFIQVGFYQKVLGLWVLCTYTIYVAITAYKVSNNFESHAKEVATSRYYDEIFENSQETA